MDKEEIGAIKTYDDLEKFKITDGDLIKLLNLLIKLTVDGGLKWEGYSCSYPKKITLVSYGITIEENFNDSDEGCVIFSRYFFDQEEEGTDGFEIQSLIKNLVFEVDKRKTLENKEKFFDLILDLERYGEWCKR